MSDGDEETPFGRAFAAERSGEFALAADYYVAAAARAMARGGYDSGRYSREGLGYLLRALVYDVRAGRRERARACRATYDPAVDRLVRTADERAVRGLAQEVRGDTHLVCGQGDRALSCYDRAGEAHAGLGLDSRLFWTATPEYTVVLGALQLFFEGQGLAYDAPEVDCEGRLDWKRTYVETGSPPE